MNRCWGVIFFVGSFLSGISTHAMQWQVVPPQDTRQALILTGVSCAACLSVITITLCYNKCMRRPKKDEDLPIKHEAYTTGVLRKKRIEQV